MGNQCGNVSVAVAAFQSTLLQIFWESTDTERDLLNCNELI